MLPFQKYKNNNDQKRSTFVEMPSEAQYAIFHDVKSQQCRAETSHIKHRYRKGIFAVENRTKNYTSQLRSLWKTRARAPCSKMTNFKFAFYSCECNEFSIFSLEVYNFQIFPSTEHQDFN